jgi:type I restriction enzyme, S subunit
MTFKMVPIESLYMGLYDGPHATPKPSDEGPIFLGIGNITEDGRLDLSDVRHIAEEDFPAWTKRVTPQRGDIVFTYEATLNRYAIISEGFRGCLGRRTALIRPDHNAVNPRFLFFYFFSHEWRRTVECNILSGSTVDRIPLTKFPAFPVSLPERPVQDKIASILSAYDDLIENNARRIKILEEMAQMLYREWFVNFRFPGHRKVKLVKSELGAIPQSCRVMALGDVIDFENGKAVANSTDGSFPLYGSNGVIGKVSIPKYKNAIVIGRVGAYCGSTMYCPTSFWASDNTIVARPVSDDLICVEAAYRLLQNLSLRRYAGGSAQPLLTQTVLRRLKVVLPNADTNRWVRDILNPLHGLIFALNSKNTNLRTTRDLLLPKLISGEIPVEAAEEAMEQTA